MLVKIFLLLSALISQSLWAQKHLILIGAGGEPHYKLGVKLNGTIFDRDLESLGKFKAWSDWRGDLIYNGGHADSEAIAKKYFNYVGLTQSLTQKTFDDLLDSYEKLIDSGKVTQLMVNISSHGAIRLEGEKTHRIATAEGVVQDFNGLTTTPTVKLDRLENLSKLAAKKGVKLAIIDHSCHSGSSLSLASDTTCVISNTGPNHYGYNGGDNDFSARFNKLLAPGKNLEDIYLEARRESSDPGFPMISTAQGKEVQSLIYEGLTPYLYYSLEASDKLTPYFQQKADAGELCEEDGEVKRLVAEVQDLISVGQYNQKKVLDEFTAAVKDYYDYQKAIRNWFLNSDPEILNKKYSFCSTTEKTNDKKCDEYTARNLLTMDFDQQIKREEKRGVSLVDDKYLERLRKANAVKQELLKKGSQLGQGAKFWGDHDYKKRSEALRDRVSLAQKKVYDILYGQAKARGPNPCKDFVL